MKIMTKENAKAAFAGESQAAMKYQLFAEVADKAKLPNTARLFRATAYAEQIHAMNHLKGLDGINKTSENLQAAIDGEDFEVDEMYPAYLAVAELQGETKAARAFNWALKTEEVHSELYNKAKEAVDGGNDVQIGSVHVCPVCGWTHEGEDPLERCPLCGVSWDKFKKF